MMKNIEKTVVLIEDNYIESKLVSNVIYKLFTNVRLLIYDNSKTALSNILELVSTKRNKIDLIIIDIKMPDISGLDVLRQFRQYKIYCPIIMMSTSDETKDINQSYAYGANGYVIKSVDFEQFKYNIQIMLEYWLDINQPYNEGNNYV